MPRPPHDRRRTALAAARPVALVAATVLALGGAIALGAVASPALAATGTQRTYTYEVRTLGTGADGEEFAALAGETLDDLRGWSLGGTMGFTRVGSGGDFTLWLAAAGTLPSFGPPCDPSWSCSVGRNVIINQDRWFGASAAWNAGGGSLRDYRHMVVNHEVGHWLGFGHATCGGPGQPAPVMQQQSISLQGCAWNPWPRDDERAQAAARHGVSVFGGSPVGSLDDVTVRLRTVTLWGWALDPETTAPTPVHVYVDGVGTAIGTADQARPDVAASFPRHGAGHGFTMAVDLPSGEHEVCAFAVDVAPPGGSAPLGCRRVEVGAPFGSLDTVTTGAGTITAHGWAIDPDTSTPITIHAYLDGHGAAITTADQPRPDVAAAWPGYGPNHGYRTTITTGAGTHTLCLFAINTPTGPNPAIGCRTITVGGTPFGSLDTITTGAGTITAHGWAIDPDTTTPITIHAYLDGHGAAITTADQPRPDVAAAWPGYGPNHGYRTTITTTAGTHTLCLFAINTPTGPNPAIGCRTITV